MESSGSPRKQHYPLPLQSPLLRLCCPRTTRRYPHPFLQRPRRCPRRCRQSHRGFLGHPLESPPQPCQPGPHQRLLPWCKCRHRHVRKGLLKRHPCRIQQCFPRSGTRFESGSTSGKSQLDPIPLRPAPSLHRHCMTWLMRLIARHRLQPVQYDRSHWLPTAFQRILQRRCIAPL